MSNRTDPEISRPPLVSADSDPLDLKTSDVSLYARVLAQAQELLHGVPVHRWTKEPYTTARSADGWTQLGNLIIKSQTHTLHLMQFERASGSAADSQQRHQGTFTDHETDTATELDPTHAQSLIERIRPLVVEYNQAQRAKAHALSESVLTKGSEYTWARIEIPNQPRDPSFLAKFDQMALVLARPAGPQILGLNPTWSMVRYSSFVFLDPGELCPHIALDTVVVKAESSALESLRKAIEVDRAVTSVVPRRDYRRLVGTNFFHIEQLPCPENNLKV